MFILWKRKLLFPKKFSNQIFAVIFLKTVLFLSISFHEFVPKVISDISFLWSSFKETEYLLTSQLKFPSRERTCGLSWKSLRIFNPKKVRGSVWSSPLWLSKNVTSKERVKPCFFVNFNIMINHIFPSNFSKIPQVGQKIWKLSPSILAISIDHHRFFGFFCISLLLRNYWHQLVTDEVSIFSLSICFNRLFNNYIKLYWY